MGKKRPFWETFAEEAELASEPVSVQSVVEIAGDRRVLIENHLGVCGYGQEQILVKVKFGTVMICGGGLELMHMTRHQLVIRGRIDSVCLQRRGCH